MNQKVILEFKKLIKEGKVLLKNSTLKGFNQYQYNYDVKNTKKWILISKNLIKLYFTENSDFFIKFKERTSKLNQNDYKDNLNLSIGIIESIVYLLENNLTENIIYKDKVDLLESILNQANNLLFKNNKYSSLIYVKVVFENTLFIFSKFNNISFSQKTTITELLKKLFKKDLISKSFMEKAISNYLEINLLLKNPTNITKGNVKKHISFVKNNLLRL